MTQPDFTSPLAGRIEVREPCPWCADRPMVPRTLMDEHVARLHPDVQTVAASAVVPAADRAAQVLTAEEARALAEGLGYQLYRAQDALAFVGECCDIADREQRPVTTADVREWLKGARCGRQLLADAADRAAVLEEAADALDAYIARYRSPSLANWAGAVAFLRRMAAESAAVDRVAAGCPQCGDTGACNGGPCPLRRVAAETPPAETEAQPPLHRWRVETRDGLADQWAPGSPYPDRQQAVERYEALSQHHPTWRDGTPVERRITRETTTYTVEEPDGPAVEAQPGKDTETPTVGYSGKGRLWCLTCPRPDREDVPMTIGLVCVGELCAGCGRDVVDVARAAEQQPKEA